VPDAAAPDAIESFVDEYVRRPSRVAEVCHVERVDSVPAALADLPPGLDLRWREYFAARGIERLYSHQAEAIRLALEGRNVVVVTSTSSGKTLCFNVPVLDGLLRGEQSYALYLYPTKALAQDQMRVLDEMLRALGLDVDAGVFDGDTSPDLRRRLRRQGRIILTNPDMLHQSILPHHGGWSGLFSALGTVVIDEIHSLRGTFGSNVACVLRRLRRIAAHYGSRPRFLLASATIANPKEHAERLLGEPVEVVDRDGSPRGRRTVILWNPPLFRAPDGSVRRKGPLSVASRLLGELVRRRVRAICFAGARNSVELVLRYSTDRLRRSAATRPLAEKIEAYRGGYLPEERRQIEARLFRGELLAVVSTNALELGIDVGGLDACLCAGYPGSVASFLQQAGRAGRRSRRSLVVFIAGSEPIDQYFMRHPESFFGLPTECATVEPENPYILTKHLVCAAHELPLAEGETLFGADYRGILRLLGESGRLREADGKWFHVERDFPAKKVKLRTVGEENFTIFELSAAKTVGELDYVAALLSLYEGAVYLHRSETHVVEKLDVENQIAYIRREDTGYYTQALCQKRVHVDEEIEVRAWRAAELRLGEVTVETRVTGFKKVRFYTTENVGYGEVDLPPVVLETVAVFLDLPERLVRVAAEYGAEFFHSGLVGCGRLLSSLAPFFVMADPRDLDFFIDGRRLYLYDLYPGGIGYAEKAHERFDPILDACLEHLKACGCPSGCPSCVLPASSRYEIGSEASVREYPFPKEATRFLLHALLEKEPYEPRLEPVEVRKAPALAPREELDPKVARKVVRAMERIGKSRQSTVGGSRQSTVDSRQ
jgi:DEAD/DEAH box helicase domain-containing protein